MMTRHDLRSLPKSDTHLAVLQIGDIARGIAETLTSVNLQWAATHELAQKIPNTPATLSLRVRRLAYAICDSLRVSLEKFPLPEEIAAVSARTDEKDT